MKRNAKNFVVGLTAALGLMSYSGTAAADDSADLDVTVEIAGTCTIDPATLDFGTYDPIVTHAASSLSGSVALDVSCTDDYATEIDLGEGSNPTGTSSAADPERRLRKGATTNYLNYQLYTDVGLATVWGTGAGENNTYTGTGAADTITVYGEIFGAQSQPAGTYVDTVVATILF